MWYKIYSKGPVTSPADEWQQIYTLGDDARFDDYLRAFLRWSEEGQLVRLDAIPDAEERSAYPDPVARERMSSGGQLNSVHPGLL